MKISRKTLKNSAVFLAIYMRELLKEIFVKRIPARGCISPLRFWISEGIFPEQELSTLVKEKNKQFMKIPPFWRWNFVLVRDVYCSLGNRLGGDPAQP